MKTLLVSGSDTGIGKTHVVGALARLLRDRGAAVRIVKPVETGRGESEVACGDATTAARMAGLSEESAHTPLRFVSPLAPRAAAEAEGRALVWADLVDGVEATPGCDWRIIEGAGGLAVPLT